MFLKKCESAGLKYYDNSKTFIDHSNNVNDIYEGIQECSLSKKRKILIMFDGMIPKMLSNKKLNLIVAELFLRGWKLNIFLVFITESCLLDQNILGKISNKKSH